MVCPHSLPPLDLTQILRSVARTGRFLVVEEGIGFASFGAEVIAALAAHGALRHRVRRVAPAPHRIPGAINAERQQRPDACAITRAVLERVP